MIIVTSGKKYIDIDAYASGVAYAKLLNSQGKSAVFMSSAKVNSSVPEFLQMVGDCRKSVDGIIDNKNDKFIIVDVSNPNFFDTIVNCEQIIEVIDHHYGYETIWIDKNFPVQIEFIGSVATIIFERFVHCGRLDLLDKHLCQLLVCAILDNTLNLKSRNTTQRDIFAYSRLKEIGGLGDEFVDRYFLACQKDIECDLISSIESDVKKEKISKYLPEVFAQLTIYDIDNIKNIDMTIINYMNNKHDEWILNMICLKSGQSCLYVSENFEQKISMLFNQSIVCNKLVLNKVMLRKEIIKHARTFYCDEDV